MRPCKLTGLRCLLLLLAVVAAAAGAGAIDAAPSPAPFPDAFVVATGTTIPFGDSIDPISQSGTIYFDKDAQKARIDHFWMGNRRSFIVDLANERGYLLTNAECVTSRIAGALLPMAVPASALRDAELQIVRHVPVTHYQAYDRTADAQRQHVTQLDYFVRQQNLTAVLDDGKETSVSYWTPWRSESRRSDRRELAAPPRARPNWMFWGEKIARDDQLVPNFESRVARVVRDVVVTVDYFDFTPMRPDPSVFDPPAQCDRNAFTHSFAHDVDIHEAQRHLTELSFNTEAGHRIVDEMNNQAKRRRIAADDATGTRHRQFEDVHVHAGDL